MPREALLSNIASVTAELFLLEEGKDNFSRRYSISITSTFFWRSRQIQAIFKRIKRNLQGANCFLESIRTKAYRGQNSRAGK